MLPNWNWKFKQSHLYLLPYPYVIFVIISKGIFSHDEEKIVAFCLIIFAIILYHAVNTSLKELFEERSATIAAEYREVIQVRRGILPKMRRFMRLFMDLEDAIARTGVCLFYDITNIIKQINKNRNKFGVHFVKNQINLVFISNRKLTVLKNNLRIYKSFFKYKKDYLINKKKTNKIFNFIDVNNSSFYLFVNRL